ncbi:MAG: DUF4350 domain-containing protein [Planctomycetes bacterium]|nr:DUF4350 domain-containing protein [Planctomycetota bacterium]
MRKLLVLLISLAVAGLCVWAFYRLAYWSSRGGEESPLYSTRRHDPYGTAALLDLLRERGFEARTVERPRLEKEDRGVLIQILPLSEPEVPWSSPPPRLPTRSLQDWIAEGNTVVQLTRDWTALMEEFKLAEPIYVKGGGVSAELCREIEAHQIAGKRPDLLPGKPAEASWSDSPPAPAGPEEAAKRPPLVLHSPRLLPEAAGGGWRPLASGSHGVAAGEHRHGKGRLIVVGSPEPALNGWIAEGGNLDFFLELARQGPVLFDEWSHGIGSAGTVLGLIARFGLLPALLQVIFIVFLYTWSTLGWRRLDRDEPRRQRSSSEQVETIGYLYRQVFSLAETLQRIRLEVSHRLASALRCPAAEAEAKARSVTVKPEVAAKARQIFQVLEAMERERPAMRPKAAAALGAQALTLSAQLLKETHRVR